MKSKFARSFYSTNTAKFQNFIDIYDNFSVESSSDEEDTPSMGPSTDSEEDVIQKSEPVVRVACSED